MELLTRIVAAFEAFAPKVYLDAAGHPTIGYGHLLKPSEHFSGPITREQAGFLLENDLKEAGSSVEAILSGAILEQHERDALISFTFNLGPKALKGSTLRQRVLQGNRRGAAAEFLRWVYYTDPHTAEMKQAAGLVRRRHCESVWFLGAAPDTVAWIAGIKLAVDDEV